jgi:hypothetical protein
VPAPYAELVLHIHREAIHHLSEVCLVRDLCLGFRRIADSSCPESLPAWSEPDEKEK